jgi:hypothetical protein
MMDEALLLGSLLLGFAFFGSWLELPRWEPRVLPRQRVLGGAALVRVMKGSK